VSFELSRVADFPWANGLCGASFLKLSKSRWIFAAIREDPREPCTLKALPRLRHGKARSAVFLPDVPAIHVFRVLNTRPEPDAFSGTMR